MGNQLRGVSRILIVLAMFAVNAAFAQVSSQDVSAGGLRFNTEGDVQNTDTRKALEFKTEDGKAAKPAPYKPEGMIPEDAPFKTYIGYPKHQIGANIMLQSVSAKWTYGEQDFNWSTSATGWQLFYNMIATPQWNFRVEYTTYEVAIDEGTVTPFLIKASDTQIDSYFVKGAWCHIFQGNFNRRLCPGIDLGYDSYPVLSFASNSELAIDKVKDLIIGVNVMFQTPLVRSFTMSIKGGYNMGTGVGNEGTLSSEGNSAFYGDLDFNLPVAEHSTIHFGVDGSMRTAEVKGKKGAIEDKWETESAVVSINGGYSYTF